jgi:NAD+ synthase/NAD+ synthase (glutamine-hydrolysing)
MKVALVQVSPTVGDLSGNVHKLTQALKKASEEGADLAVCCELAITAYPPRDYLDRAEFIDAQGAALQSLAAQSPLPAFVGFIDRQDVEGQTRLFNAAAYIDKGAVQEVIHKTLLPTYDVFDEARYFTPARTRRLIDVGGTKVGISICEDIWNDAEHWDLRRYSLDPVEELAELGAELLINLSASPFWQDKRQIRQEMLCAQAKKHALPLLVVNQVGAHDDLIFDGGSLAIDAKGEVRGRCKELEPDLLLVSVDTKSGSVSGTLREVHGFDPEGETRAGLDALILGLREYAHKCGFKSAVLGLSGGIDSALTAAIAAAALGPENVYGVALPSKYSSDHSLSDAEALAEAMGIHCQTIPIASSVAAFEEALAGNFAGLEEDVTEENIQARSRGVILMALSNKFGHLLLNTGNKSEVAVGYCTLYGDMCGGLSILSDVFKTEVYRMAEEVNRRAGKAVIPESTLRKPPSAELRPGQLDQDSLPAYEILDDLLDRYVEKLETAESLREHFPPEVVERVLKMIHRAEYKRYQLAPGLKIRYKSFGPGRRMPLASKSVEASQPG